MCCRLTIGIRCRPTVTGSSDSGMNFRSRARAFSHAGVESCWRRFIALILQKRKYRSQGLVVAMHETPASLEAQLREQLEFASQHFTITTLDGFGQAVGQSAGIRYPFEAAPAVYIRRRKGKATTQWQLRCSNLLGGRGVFFRSARIRETLSPGRGSRILSHENEPGLQDRGTKKAKTGSR